MIKHKVLITSISSICTIILFIIATINVFFPKYDIDMSYIVIKDEKPNKIKKINDEINKSEIKNDEFQESIIKIGDYFDSEDKVLNVTISNISKRKINNISIHINNIYEYNYINIEGYKIDQDEIDNIYSKINYLDVYNVLFIEDIVEMPPESKIELKLWGKFNEKIIPPMVLKAYYDDRVVCGKKLEKVKGIKAMLEDKIGIIIILGLTIYIGLFIFIIDKFCNK